MKISLIYAMDLDRGIGLNNHLPWRLPSDLQRFKKMTMGHHIIMGRKTYESIGKPLSGRENIIVTRNRAYQAAGCHVVHSIQEAIDLAKSRGEQEVFIIGGAEIYAKTIDIADHLYQTTVHVHGKADTFFPAFNPGEWKIESSDYSPADDANEHPTTFAKLSRLGPAISPG